MATDPAGLAALVPVELAALVVAAFAGSVIFGITGFGAALVTVPLATHFVPLPFALALFVLMDLVNAFRIGFENPKNAVRAEWLRLVPGILLNLDVWTCAAAVVPAGLTGLWAASHLFRRISRDTLMRAVALMLLASGASLVLRAS